PSLRRGCGYAGAEKLSQPRKAILSCGLFAARARGARRQAAFPAHVLELRPQGGELTHGRGVARSAPRGDVGDAPLVARRPRPRPRAPAFAAGGLALGPSGVARNPVAAAPSP